jgi:hypothetical protein
MSPKPFSIVTFEVFEGVIFFNHQYLSLTHKATCRSMLCGPFSLDLCVLHAVRRGHAQKKILYLQFAKKSKDGGNLTMRESDELLVSMTTYERSTRKF